MGDQGNKILLDAVGGAIKDLSTPHEGAVCPSHGGLVNGVRVLLLCKEAEMSNGGSASSIKIGNVTITGTIGMLVAGFIYLLAKSHGFI